MLCENSGFHGDLPKQVLMNIDLLPIAEIVCAERHRSQMIVGSQMFLVRFDVIGSAFPKPNAGGTVHVNSMQSCHKLDTAKRRAARLSQPAFRSQN